MSLPMAELIRCDTCGDEDGPMYAVTGAYLQGVRDLVHACDSCLDEAVRNALRRADRDRASVCIDRVD
jgi:hypothetical protein